MQLLDKSPEKFVIQGGKSLNGVVSLSGAKNAALPIIVASTLADEDVVLENVPLFQRDVQITLEIIKAIGGSVLIQDGKVIINGRDINSMPPDNLCNKIRSSLIFLGVLLAKKGSSRVAVPGGCRIGERKYDLHIDGLRMLGANVIAGDQSIEASNGNNLIGSQITLYLPTTTGTQNIVFGALAANGNTVIKNANTRPENQDFFNFLNKMGAQIKTGNRIVEVEGGHKLHGTEYRIMDGTDELITYIIMAACTGGEIKIENALTSFEHEPISVQHLKASGLELFNWGGSVFVSAKNKKLQAIDIATAPWPGINSDLQPLFSIYAAVCNGDNSITDMRFTDRFQYVNGLKQFGVDIEAYGNCAVVRGGKPLNCADVASTDLRGGAAFVTAALMAEGESVVTNIEQIDRGYERLEEKLSKIGASIKRVRE